MVYCISQCTASHIVMRDCSESLLQCISYCTAHHGVLHLTVHCISYSDAGLLWISIAVHRILHCTSYCTASLLHKRDYIRPKRPIIWRGLLIVAAPYIYCTVCMLCTYTDNPSLIALNLYCFSSHRALHIVVYCTSLVHYISHSETGLLWISIAVHRILHCTS